MKTLLLAGNLPESMWIWPGVTFLLLWCPSTPTTWMVEGVGMALDWSQRYIEKIEIIFAKEMPVPIFFIFFFFFLSLISLIFFLFLFFWSSFPLLITSDFPPFPNVASSCFQGTIEQGHCDWGGEWDDHQGAPGSFDAGEELPIVLSDPNWVRIALFLQTVHNFYDCRW